MPAQPTDVPRWATDASRRLEPLSGEKDTGHVIDTKPAARKVNWLLGTIYDWILYLQNPVGTGAGAGVNATGGPTDGTGLKGSGGGTDGGGVEAVGVGTGSALVATAIDGHGVLAESDTSAPAKSALRIVPQDAEPSVSPASGDTYVNSLGRLFVFDGALWRSCNEVLTDEVTISSAEILNLHSAFKILVAAPGAGFILQFHSALLIYDFNTTAYTVPGGADLRILYVGDDAVAADIPGALLAEVFDRTFYAPGVAPTTLKISENNAFVMENIGAAYTLGDSPVRVRVWYSIMATGL